MLSYGTQFSLLNSSNNTYFTSSDVQDFANPFPTPIKLATFEPSTGSGNKTIYFGPRDYTISVSQIAGSPQLTTTFGLTFRSNAFSDGVERILSKMQYQTLNYLNPNPNAPLYIPCVIPVWLTAAELDTPHSSNSYVPITFRLIPANETKSLAMVLWFPTSTPLVMNTDYFILTEEGDGWRKVFTNQLSMCGTFSTNFNISPAYYKGRKYEVNNLIHVQIVSPIDSSVVIAPVPPETTTIPVENALENKIFTQKKFYLRR